MQTALLLLVLLPADTSVDWDEFLIRLKSTKQTAPALMKLGQWCEKEGQASWAIKTYGMALERARADKDAASTCNAAFHLARVEVSKSRYAQRGYSRLRRLRDQCPDHAEEARTLLDGVESARTRQQLSYLERGDEYVEKGQDDKALSQYEKADSLLPKDDKDSAAYVPRRTILKKLSQVRNRLDESYYRERALTRHRETHRCPGRGCSSGFATRS